MVIQMWQQSMAQGMPLSCLQQGKRAAGTTSRMSPSVIHLGKTLPPAHVLLYAVIIRLQCQLTALHRQSTHIPKMKSSNTEADHKLLDAEATAAHMSSNDMASVLGMRTRSRDHRVMPCFHLCH